MLASKAGMMHTLTNSRIYSWLKWLEFLVPHSKGKRKLSFSHKTSLTKTIEKRGFGKGNFNFEYSYQSGNSKLPV